MPFFSRRFDTNKYATENGLSIQMAARDLRYAWFEETAKAEGFTKIATAHHLDDFSETVLLNVVKGRGLDGLLGIPIQNGKLIRPLLFASRSDLETYASLEGVTWREDESNQGDDYQRNKIRHWAMPVLQEINPSLGNTMYQQGIRAALEMSLGHRAFLQWQEQFVATNHGVIRVSKPGVAWKEAPVLLFRLLDPLGFNYDQCLAMAAASTGQTGKMFFSASYQVVVDREHLVIAPMPPAFAPVQIDVYDTFSAQGVHQLIFESEYHGAISESSSVAFIDSRQLVYPLTWRSWKEGDTFSPLGMNHSKKVSDFLIDRKLTRIEKDTVTVLESDGKIVWVVGQRIDHRVRVVPQTVSVLKIEYIRQE